MWMAESLCSRRAAGSRCTVLELAFPWALIALPLPVLVRWLVPPYKQQVNALRVPFFHSLVEAAGGEAQSGAVAMRRRWIQTINGILVWVLLVVALAKPEWVGDPIVRTEASRVQHRSTISARHRSVWIHGLS